MHPQSFECEPKLLVPLRTHTVSVSIRYANDLPILELLNQAAHKNGFIVGVSYDNKIIRTGLFLFWHIESISFYNLDMELIICKDSLDLVYRVSERVLRALSEVKANSLYVPAGATPVPLYDLWQQARPKQLGSIQLLQVDEVISGPRQNMFRKFFETHLSLYRDQFVPVERPMDVAKVALLGLGLNGHVAFHEPHVPPNFEKGEVDLSPQTLQEIGASAPTKGMTYGIGTFMKTEFIFLMVSGAKKRRVLQQVLSGNLLFPASYLLRHPNLVVLTDQEALGEMTS